MKISKEEMRKITGGGAGTGGIGSPSSSYFLPPTTGPSEGADTTDPIAPGPVTTGREDSYDSYDTMG